MDNDCLFGGEPEYKEIEIRTCVTSLQMDLINEICRKSNLTLAEYVMSLLNKDIDVYLRQLAKHFFDE